MVLGSGGLSFFLIWTLGGGSGRVMLCLVVRWAVEAHPHTNNNNTTMMIT